MEKQQIEPYKKFAQSYYANKDSAHDFRHIERIIDCLDFFAQELPRSPNKALLYFIACFHGLEKNLRHDRTFRDQAIGFLQELEWTKAEIEQAFQGLERHLSHPQTIEEKIVHDANYVELLGAFGIAKAFTTGGAYQQTYEETADIFEHQYLDRIKFVTPIGKRLAQEKKAYTKKFLQQLRSEL
ncbi:MAG: hypothetical protein ACFCU7_03315 [Pleurocapsa sp.]